MKTQGNIKSLETTVTNISISVPLVKKIKLKVYLPVASNFRFILYFLAFFISLYCMTSVIEAGWKHFIVEYL